MTTLPSISNLLNDTHSHHTLSSPPSFHLSPPSPKSSFKSSSALLSPTIPPNNDLTNTLTISTPALSPSTSSVSLSPRIEDLPPLQGYDPPVRKLSGTPIVAPWSNDTNNNMIVATPPSPPDSSSSSSTCSSIPSPPPSHTYQKHHHHHHNHSHLPSPPPTTLTKHQRPRPLPITTTKPSTQQQPTAQILISPTTGQPILKRRRGRPPTNREPVNDGGFTFLAPVTWTVQQPPVQEQVAEPKTDQHEMMAAFSSANMDTVLQMPRKKRGRKPKTQLAGNSCFVWKELPTTRSTKKIMKKVKA